MDNLGAVRLSVLALAGFIPAAFAALVGVAMPLARSVRRLGALAPAESLPFA
jgi:hypothetical protein